MFPINERSDAHVASVALSVYHLRRDREGLATAAILCAKASSCQSWPRTSTNGTHIASARNADETSKVAKSTRQQSLEARLS
jgi:hypothetical protein